MAKFYPNKNQNLQSIGALLILIGILLSISTNTEKWFGVKISPFFTLLTTSVGLFMIGLSKFIFYKNGWGEKFTFIIDHGNTNLEKPFASKLEKTIILIESIICFTVSVGLLLFGIYTTLFITK